MGIMESFLTTSSSEQAEGGFFSRLCHHLSNAGILDPAIKEKMALMTSWFPVSDLISQIRVSKHCIIDLSEFVKT